MFKLYNTSFKTQEEDLEDRKTRRLKTTTSRSLQQIHYQEIVRIITGLTNGTREVISLVNRMAEQQHQCLEGIEYKILELEERITTLEQHQLLGNQHQPKKL